MRNRMKTGAAPIVNASAGVAIRDVIDGPRRPARLIASFATSAYLELDDLPQPRVIALSTPDAVRLPNAVVLGEPTLPALTSTSSTNGRGAGAAVGFGEVCVGRLHVRIRRWWDARPMLPALPVTQLATGLDELERLRAASPKSPGLTGDDGVDELARRCATGELAQAVEATERLVGLGPGLTPSGDDVIAGALLALRVLGEAVHLRGNATSPATGPPRQGRQAATPRAAAYPPAGPVWLADWLGAAVVADVDTRTTSLSASLLHYAACGQVAGQVAAVLRGLAGQEPLERAVNRLLGIGHTSGADLAWGLAIGARAVCEMPGRGQPPEVSTMPHESIEHRVGARG